MKPLAQCWLTALAETPRRMEAPYMALICLHVTIPAPQHQTEYPFCRGRERTLLLKAFMSPDCFSWQRTSQMVPKLGLLANMSPGHIPGRALFTLCLLGQERCSEVSVLCQPHTEEAFQAQRRRGLSEIYTAGHGGRRV